MDFLWSRATRGSPDQFHLGRGKTTKARRQGTGTFWASGMTLPGIHERPKAQEIHGIVMEILWNIYGIFMEYLWKIMEYLW